MFKVNAPEDMNETFVRAYNSRKLANLLALYEPTAIVRVDAERTFAGTEQIASALGEFLSAPGTLRGRNNFCLVQGEIALLRADYSLVAPDGSVVLSGSSAEIVRRQPDGTWLYVIDHAAGASVPRVATES